MTRAQRDRVLDKLWALADHPKTPRPEAEAALARVAALLRKEAPHNIITRLIHGEEV